MRESSISRSLIGLICCLGLVETAFFVVLAPILADITDQFGASHTQAGILSAAYAAGGTVGAIPGGLLAWKLGPRITVLIGLAVLSAGTFAFGLVDHLWLLDAARFAQGIGGALIWISGLVWVTRGTAARRRGEAIGFVMAAALVGALLGPLLGAAAADFGRAWVFATFSVFGVALGIWTWLLQDPPPSAVTTFSARALRHPDVVAGLWLVFIAGLFFGVLAVLAPLKLSALDFSPLFISIVFVIAAAIEAAITPLLGRWYDEGGRLPLVRAALVSSAGTAFLLAILSQKWLFATSVLLAAIAFGSFWLPGTAVLSSGVELSGLEPAVGFALWNGAWAPANVVGALLAGWLSDATGDAVPYILVVLICILTLSSFGRRQAAAQPV